MAKQTLVTNRHYHDIDTLRGFAVLLVIWFHASNFTYNLLADTSLDSFTLNYLNIALLGQTGVDLFFVLSGFLITGILIDTHKDPDRYKKFLIRRTLRIFPLYYGFLAAFVVMSIILGATVWPDILQYIFYVQNWSLQHRLDHFAYLNHTWSLAVEEQFYIIWPVLFWACYKRSLKLTIGMTLALIILSTLLRFYFIEIDQYKRAANFTLSHMDGLVLGALLSILVKHYGASLEKNLKNIKYVAIFCGLIALCIPVLSHTPLDAHQNIIKYGLSVSALFYVSILAIIILKASRQETEKSHSINMMQKIGKVSYGVYVFHMPVCLIAADLCNKYIGGFWLSHVIVFLLTAFVSYFCAKLCYEEYEKRFLQLKDKWAPHT